MRIRSLTYFCDPGWPLQQDRLGAAGNFLAQAKSAYESGGYEVQTTRLATIPFPAMLGGYRLAQLPELAAQLEAGIRSVGINYASLGPASPEYRQSYELIPEALSATQNIFLAGFAADRVSGIYPSACRACAQIISRSASIERNGFANLRFAALANVPAGSPFFPAAYWDGFAPAFAVATEAADLAVEAFTEASSLEAGRTTLIAEIEKHASQIEKIASELTLALDCTFEGIDFSLAPFPAEMRSLGTAFERLGVPKVGMHGSLAAAAILTESIDRAVFPRAGFSGLFLPILEDKILAERAASGTLTLKDVLLYSAVCGTGLDTVPLPGDTSEGQLTALLIDLSALALRLDKPLTARLMPIPGKKAGDPTAFDFDFFANSRVMSLDAEELSGYLAGKDPIPLQARK